MTNFYTQQPIANLKLEVIKSFSKGYFNEGLRTVLDGETDSSGHYKFHFEGKPNNSYFVRYDGDFFDLTSGHYGSHIGTVTVGKANTVDYDITPPVTAQVDVSISKNGKSFLQVYFLGAGGNGTIVTDTARVNQQLRGLYSVPVMPNRNYQFIVYRANTAHDGPYNLKAVDPTYEYYERFIGNNDTTIIRLR